jgi:hypothetical protein
LAREQFTDHVPVQLFEILSQILEWLCIVTREPHDEIVQPAQ